MRYFAFLLFFAVAGCTVTVHTPRPVRYYAPEPMERVYVEPPPRAVISVYIEPPIEQPPTIAVRWAPPPMLVMTPPPQPYPIAVWTGGYWVWDGDWVWAYGRWADPPRPGYRWMHPYYENRNGLVMFVNGYWARPEAVFVPPAFGINIAISEARLGVVVGMRPIGPSGIFVPPPPGSRSGIIIPAPIGTPPAVVTSAPPVINTGMRINRQITNINSNNTTINNTTINNITNVTIVAPPSATATGQTVNLTVPAQSHLAAARNPVVRIDAPRPISTTPIPAYAPGRSMSQLPPPQTVKPVVPPELRQKQQDRDLDRQRKDQEQHKREDVNRGEQDASRQRELELQRKNQELRQREEVQRKGNEAKSKQELNQKEQEALKKQQEDKKKNLDINEKDAKRKKQDLKQREQEAKKKKLDLKQKELEARKKQQEDKKKELDENEKNVK